MQKNYYTYIIECEDGSYYTGYTTDLQKRFSAHKTGKGAKYTRAHKPVQYAYIEHHDTKSDAMKRECAIKKLSHKEKDELITEFTKRLLIYSTNLCMSYGGLRPC